MSGRQPGAVPSFRRVTTPSGRHLSLSVSAGKRTNESSVYVGRLIETGERVTIQRLDGVWKMNAWRTTYNDPGTGSRFTAGSTSLTSAASAWLQSACGESRDPCRVFGPAQPYSRRNVWPSH